ncbi:MAG: MFS transporter [Xanthomonadales bacterium]|nr:MFS transporter [Xanthomonadales bacterium]
MAASLILSDSPRTRFITGASMYFAQGIPQGLLAIAIPAWLASLDVSAADIGTYLAVIVLPWAFKLVTGPFMDRYQYLPMGRRKPWVLGAQVGLTLSLLALMLIENPVEQIGLLMLIGVLINSFAATQDVAVDGMSIDLTPVAEQGRLNSYMSFGKAAGWGITAAVSGVLLAKFGIEVTAIVASVAAGLVGVGFALVREREGERKLPWTQGRAIARRRPGHGFGAVFSGINRVLWKRASIMVMLVMVLDGLVYGYGQALMPIAAVKLFGYTAPQWSQLVAIMGLVGAGLALALGPLIDRFGAKPMLVTTISLVGVHAFLIAQTQFLWQDSLYVRTVLSVWIVMLPVVMVCSLALAMSICSSKASATQFAIYMSAANLGHSAGSKLYGMTAEGATYAQNYTFLALLVLGMVLILIFYRHRDDDEGEGGRHVAPVHTVATGVDGGGLYFSGAMRCPKCRADMELLHIDGIEVDRCTDCRGIWFDEGEMEALNNREAAVAIDTGSAREGRVFDSIEDYRCPRCGGEMNWTVDADQRHIGYEVCADCRGAYLDAGEFRDLSQKTLSDLVKRVIFAKD